MLVQWAESELSELSCRFTFEGVQSYLCGSELRCDPLSQVDDLGMRLSHHTFVDLNLKNFLPIPPEQHTISPSPNDNLFGRAQITISHSIIHCQGTFMGGILQLMAQGFWNTLDVSALGNILLSAAMTYLD